MPKTVIVPPGTGKPLAPYVPGTLADGVLYVSGTLPLEQKRSSPPIGDHRLRFTRPHACKRPGAAETGQE